MICKKKIFKDGIHQALGSIPAPSCLVMDSPIIPYLNLLNVTDGIGIYGNFFHYAIVISLVGSAFLIFLYLWRKKRLDMDEEPKFQMMQEEIKQGEQRKWHKKD